MRCLWLSGAVPEPGRSGLEAYSLGLTEALSRAGASVTGLGWSPTGAAPNGRLTTWRTVSGGPGWRPASLLGALPAMARRFATAGYRRALSIALRESWDAVVVDHLQMAWALPAVLRAREGGRVRSLVYAAHNHESAVRAAVASDRSAALPLRLARRLDALKVARLEARVTAAADLVTALTDSDAEALRAGHEADRLLVVPPGYAGPGRPERRLTARLPRRAVIFGSLSWSVKVDNLRRFLRVADPLFGRAGAELHVAGSAGERTLERLRRLAPGTTLLGRVESPAAPLQDARIGLVVEGLGGGFKLKSLDYVFNRVPLLMLEGSCAGLPIVAGRDALVFPDERSLAVGALRAMDDLELLNRLQERAYAACAGRFDWDERGRALLAAITQSLRPGAAPAAGFAPPG